MDGEGDFSTGATVTIKLGIGPPYSGCSEGPITQCLRFLVAKAMPLLGFGIRNFKCWVLGPSELCMGVAVRTIASIFEMFLVAAAEALPRFPQSSAKKPQWPNNLYVYMYIYIYVYLYLSLYFIAISTLISISISMSISVSICLSISASMYLYISICTYICMYDMGGASRGSVEDHWTNCPFPALVSLCKAEGLLVQDQPATNSNRSDEHHEIRAIRSVNSAVFRLIGRLSSRSLAGEQPT